MWTRNTIACVLTVALLAAAPVYAQGKSGKGGGKGGGGGDDGGGDTPPDVCLDRSAAFVYRTENSKGGEDIMLASSEGCSITLLTSRAYRPHEHLAYHLDRVSGKGIILWAEQDPEDGWVALDIWTLSFDVGEDGAVTVGPEQQLVSAFDNVLDPTFTRLPGDVRQGESGSMYAIFLHRDWVQVDNSATSDIHLMEWAPNAFPHDGPVNVTTVPANLSLCYADDDCLDTGDDNVSLRLDSPVFGTWSAGGPLSLFANFKLRRASGDGFGGILYWPDYLSDPFVLAYSAITYGSSDPRIASTSPDSPDSEILLRHFVSEKGKGEYYGSVIDVNCLLPPALDGADAWQQCLGGTDGRQIVGARFGAAWLEPGVIVHSMHSRKSTDIYHYDSTTGSSTPIITGGMRPVAAH